MTWSDIPSYSLNIYIIQNDIVSIQVEILGIFMVLFLVHFEIIMSG